MFNKILNDFFITHWEILSIICIFIFLIYLNFLCPYCFDFKLNFYCFILSAILISIFYTSEEKRYLFIFLFYSIILTVITDYLTLRCGKMMWKFILWLICPLAIYIILKSTIMSSLPDFILYILISAIALYIFHLCRSAKKFKEENPNLAYYILPIFFNIYYIGLRKNPPNIPHEKPTNKKELFENKKYSVKQINLLLNNLKPNKIYMFDTNSSIRSLIFKLFFDNKLIILNYFRYKLFSLFKNKSTLKKFYGKNTNIKDFIKNPDDMHYFKIKWLG